MKILIFILFFATYALVTSAQTQSSQTAIPANQAVAHPVQPAQVKVPATTDKVATTAQSLTNAKTENKHKMKLAPAPQLKVNKNISEDKAPLPLPAVDHAAKILNNKPGK